MTNQEVLSAIADFRNAFRDDLGSPFLYGVRVLSEDSGGFYIDRQIETISWVDQTSQGYPLYCTLSSLSDEEMKEAGIYTECTGVITCIYKDILDVKGGTISRSDIQNDVVHILSDGMDSYYRIVDMSTAFQLKDTYIFVKFGVVQVTKEEIEDGTG